MKWVKINHEGRPTYGILNGSKIALTSHSWDDILAGKPVEVVSKINREMAAWLNPLGRPGKIICVGLNYMDHCLETNTPPPERPYAEQMSNRRLANLDLDCSLTF